MSTRKHIVNKVLKGYIFFYIRIINFRFWPKPAVFKSQDLTPGDEGRGGGVKGR